MTAENKNTRKKIGKERVYSYQNNEEISGRKAYSETHGSSAEMFLRSQMSFSIRRELFVAPSLPCVHIHLLSSDRERHL